MEHFVMDRQLRPLPQGACGELIICGAGVGRGYVKLPERTAASFFTFRGLPAYHSGDLVRLNANGEFDYYGRLDNQVKLRGLRIELDEIENVINEYPGVRLSKVIVRNNGTEDYLAGYWKLLRIAAFILTLWKTKPSGIAFTAPCQMKRRASPCRASSTTKATKMKRSGGRGGITATP